MIDFLAALAFVAAVSLPTYLATMAPTARTTRANRAADDGDVWWPPAPDDDTDDQPTGS